MKAVTCKSILTKSKLPNVDYCCNPYIGCTHGCKYCYASFMRRFTGHLGDQWGKFIDYKHNAVEVLKKEMKKLSKGGSVLLGSVTDAYQHAETKLRLTRGCLEVFLEHQANVDILTKSDLVLRDIDLLKGIKNSQVGISCGIQGDKACNVLEPYASNFDKRVAALETLHQNNITTYAFVGPIIPFITDLEIIFKAVSPHVDYIMGEFLNLKGCNNAVLHSALSEITSEQEATKIINLSKNEDLIETCREKFNSLCEKYNLPNRGFFCHTQDKEK